MSLLESIEKIAAGFKGELGVSVKHLETGETASYNGEMVFPTASVFKIPVIVEFFRLDFSFKVANHLLYCLLLGLEVVHEFINLDDFIFFL